MAVNRFTDYFLETVKKQAGNRKRFLTDLSLYFGIETV